VDAGSGLRVAAADGPALASAFTDGPATEVAEEAIASGFPMGSGRRARRPVAGSAAEPIPSETCRDVSET